MWLSVDTYAMCVHMPGEARRSDWTQEFTGSYK